MSESDFRPATAAEVELALRGVAQLNLYVFMKASQRHILYVSALEAVEGEKKENLRRLSQGEIFVRKGDVPHSQVVTNSLPLPPNAAPLNAGKAFDGEVLGDQAASALKEVYRNLLQNGGGDPGQISAAIADLADSILSVVAPEVGDIKTTVVKSARNAQYMNDTAAITSLGVMCALANDFKSRTALQNLSHAIVMMDAALSDLESWELETYYRNRRELPAHALEKIQNHPVKSQQMVAYLPVANETVNQLILHHHELHNGKGYHRGIHTAHTIPLGRVLALAVDIYENLRAAELSGSPRTLDQVVTQLYEKGVEPHMRRHQAVIVKAVADFLGLKLG